LIESWEEVYISLQQFSKRRIDTQQISIGYIPTYSLVLNIFQITNFDTLTMVLELNRIKELSKVPLDFLHKFFHENHLFFETFEIVTKTNGYLILIFSKKLKSMITGF